MISSKLLCLAALLGLFALALVSAKEFDEEKFRKMLENSTSPYDVISDCKLCDKLVLPYCNRKGPQNKTDIILYEMEKHLRVYGLSMCQLVNSTGSDARSDIANRLRESQKGLQALQLQLEAKVDGFSNSTQNGLVDLTDEIQAFGQLSMVRMQKGAIHALLEEMDWYENRTRNEHCREFNLTQRRQNVMVFMVQLFATAYQLVGRTSAGVRQHQELWKRRIVEKANNNETGVAVLSGQLGKIETDLMQTLREMSPVISGFRRNVLEQWEQLVAEEPDLEKTMVKRVLKLLVYDAPALFIQMHEFLHNRVQTLHEERAKAN